MVQITQPVEITSVWNMINDVYSDMELQGHYTKEYGNKGYNSSKV